MRSNQFYFLLISLLSKSILALSISTYNIENYGATGFYYNETQDPFTLIGEISKLKSDLIILQEVSDPNKLLTDLAITPGYNFGDYGVRFSKYGGGGRQRLAFLYKTKRLSLLSTKEDFALTRTSNRDRSKCHYASLGEVPTREEIEGFKSYRGKLVTKCGRSRPAFIGYFKDKKTNQTITAIAVHLKSGGGEKNIAKRDYQFETLREIVNYERITTPNVVVGGDFNTVDFIDRTSSEYSKHSNFAKQADMTFVDDSMPEESRCSSYWDGGDLNQFNYKAGFLDHILVTNDFMFNYTYDTSITGAHCNSLENMCSPETFASFLEPTHSQASDHCPVTAFFNDPSSRR